LKPNNNSINKKATIIFGRNKVNGDVLLILKESDFEFIDFDKIIFDKIFDLADFSFDTRDLQDDEKKEDVRINNLPVIMNKYCILKKRYSFYNNICNFCKSSSNETLLICSGCYKTKYHNNNCQQKDWENHKKECLYNKQSINKY